MEYLAVKWNHSYPDMPVEIFSELDTTRNEIRKVEVFRDGSLGWASRTGARGGTQLGLEAVPPLIEISRDAEFNPRDMSRENFEEVWARATEAH